MEHVTMDGDVKCVRLKGSDGTDVAQSLIKTNIVAKAPVQGWKKSVSRYERNLKSMLDWLRVSVAKVQYISVVLPMEPVQFPPKDTKAAGYSQLI